MGFDKKSWWFWNGGFECWVRCSRAMAHCCSKRGIKILFATFDELPN